MNEPLTMADKLWLGIGLLLFISIAAVVEHGRPVLGSLALALLGVIAWGAW